MKSQSNPLGATGLLESSAVVEERTTGAEGNPETRDEIYLHPGQLFVSSSPYAVKTILGSCVAVCLWDPSLRIGGVNHYLLPHWAGSGQSSPRFGNIAIQQLLERLLAQGAAKHRLCAKVFGGACVLPSCRDPKKHLGSRNSELAFQILSSEGIPLISQDVGGNQGRKVIFHTDSGSAWVRRL